MAFPETVFATGVFRWVWIVEGFEDDTFGDGEYIDFIECSADTKEGLILEEREFSIQDIG